MKHSHQNLDQGGGGGDDGVAVWVLNMNVMENLFPSWAFDLPLIGLLHVWQQFIIMTG